MASKKKPDTSKLTGKTETDPQTKNKQMPKEKEREGIN